jgi:GNAT superfamily N-acetyltransferase
MPIVPFQTEHRGGVLRIHAQTFEPLDLASHFWQPCQQIESLDQDCPRFIYREEILNGYVAAYRLDDLHFRLNLIVDAHHRGRGIGSLLLERIQSETEAMGGEYLQARLLENMQASHAFAVSRGFAEVHVMRGMSLHSADFIFDRWQPLGPELSARGLLVTTLKTELEKDRDPVEKLARLHWHARQGWPSPDPTWGIDASIESCKSLFTDIPCPEHFSIMKCGNEYVGYTSARNRLSATAVHPEYRGIGVATYLKAYNLRACISSGHEHFESATANPAMQRVNEKLGYRLNGVSEVRLLKRL